MTHVSGWCVRTHEDTQPPPEDTHTQCRLPCHLLWNMQDVLRLDNSARMNSPGKAAGNWGWRMSNSWEGLQNEAQNLRWLAGISNRLPAKAAKDFKM